MKQSKYLSIILVLLLIILAGCQDKEQPDVQPQPESKVDTGLIEAVVSDSISTEGMTKLREFSVDLDLDSTDERIELYTAAERNEKGEMV